MQILEITQKQFLDKLKGNPHPRMLSVIKDFRKQNFPSHTGAELKLQSKTKYLPQNASYKLYIRFMPIELTLKYNAKAIPQDIIAARAALTSTSVPKLNDLIYKEFPKGGKYDSFSKLTTLVPGESYVIQIWVHSPRQ